MSDAASIGVALESSSASAPSLITHARHQNHHRRQVGTLLAVGDGVREGIDAVVATIQRLKLPVGVVRVVSVRVDVATAPDGRAIVDRPSESTG